MNAGAASVQVALHECNLVQLTASGSLQWALVYLQLRAFALRKPW